MNKPPKLLPGCTWRPWLAETGGPKFGQETRCKTKGRVRVNLGAKHRYANSAGWQWRYRLMACYALGRKLRGPNCGPPSGRVSGRMGRLKEGDYAEHVDHVNGVIDDDRLENLRVLSASIHGAWHARLVDEAGWRDEAGRFAGHPPKEFDGQRWGGVVSSRNIAYGEPESETLA